MDIETGLGTGLAIFGAKDLIQKLLGPTADYLGGEAKSFVEKRVENVKRIFQKGIGKLGDRIDNPGQVPPRVLSHVLLEGSFWEDELAAEYFGGILASSRATDSKDDRGASYVQLVARLSMLQLKTHYILYSCVKTLYDGLGIKLGMTEARERFCYTFIPFDEYQVAMGLDEEHDLRGLMNYVFDGLSRELLIEANWIYGNWPYIEEIDDQFGEGICFTPSAAGIELYMWAHGVQGCPVENFLDPGRHFDIDVPLAIPRRCKCAKVFLSH